MREEISRIGNEILKGILKERLVEVTAGFLKKSDALLTDRDRIFYELGFYGTVFIYPSESPELITMLDELAEAGFVHRDALQGEPRIAYTRIEDRMPEMGWEGGAVPIGADLDLLRQEEQ